MVENSGKPCSKHCKNKQGAVKQGPCDFCGAGLCCKNDKKNWDFPDNVGKNGFYDGCTGWNGGKEYQCTEKYGGRNV